MSRIIAILNQKGGVGKTTTAINVAAYLANSGKSVLLVDLDPQGNATSGLGLDKQTIENGTYEVLLGSQDFATLVCETQVDNLYVLPTNPNLAAAEVELVSALEREKALQRGLARASYDYIFIDCPPSLGLLTVNALTAADLVLIPVQAEYYALEGLGQLLQVIQRVKEGLNKRLEILGVVLTMYDGRTSLSEQVQAEVKKHFGTKVFNTIIPRNVRLAEAPSYGKPIFEHDKWSKGARAYKQLAKEVEQRAK
jgi:chromosome partitioning protein